MMQPSSREVVSITSASIPENNKKAALVQLALILVPGFVILMLLLVSLNLSLPTESYSPFHGVTALQTITATMIGMASLLALMIMEGRGRDIDLRGIIFVLLTVLLSFLIQYTADPRQLQQFGQAFALLFFLPGSIPIIEAPYFTTIYLLPLIVYGGLLGLLLSYLLSRGKHDVEKSSDAALPDFAFRGLLVIFIGPAVLTIPIGFMLYLLQATPFPFFPFYGEGTGGSMLVVSVILSMYICARLICNWDRINLKELTNSKSSTIVSVILEVVAAYACTTAAFSLMGGLLTDGTPPPLILPIDYVILTILVAIPFSLLVARERIFPKRNEMQV